MDSFHSIRLRLLQGELSAVAQELRRFQLHGAARMGGWRPMLNAFRCERGMKICVDLAGVHRSQIEIGAEPTRLTIRGVRQPPEPAAPEAAVQIVTMEIDYGPFERVIDLPIRVDVANVSAEQRNGFLWISLPALAPGEAREGGCP